MDRRADIWAFGVLLYEMLAARMMFPSENVTETLAQVILKDPDWSSLPASTPRTLRHLLDRCLVRDPRNRLRDIGEARIAIQEALERPAAPETGPETRGGSRRRELVLGAVALLFMLTTAALLVRSALTPAPKLETVRFDVFPPGTNSAVAVRWIELSPDGRHLAFSTTVPSRGIFVRSLDSSEVRLVAPEIGSFQPPIFFWSADSRQIGYFADGAPRECRLPAAGRCD